MRVMIMEYNGLLWGAARYRLQWGLREILTAIRSLELTPPPRKGLEEGASAASLLTRNLQPAMRNGNRRSVTPEARVQPPPMLDANRL